MIKNIVLACIVVSAGATRHAWRSVSSEEGEQVENLLNTIPERIAQSTVFHRPADRFAMDLGEAHPGVRASMLRANRESIKARKVLLSDAQMVVDILRTELIMYRFQAAAAALQGEADPTLRPYRARQYKIAEKMMVAAKFVSDEELLSAINQFDPAEQNLLEKFREAKASLGRLAPTVMNPFM